MHFSTLHKGYFWEIVGLNLLLAPILLIMFGLRCDPFENCDTRNGSALGALLILGPVFSFLFGGGLYLVGAAHVCIAPVEWPRKLLGVVVPPLVIGLLVLVGIWIAES